MCTRLSPYAQSPLELVTVSEQMGLSVASSRNSVTWLILKKRQKRLRYLEKRMTIENSNVIVVAIFVVNVCCC